MPLSVHLSGHLWAIAPDGTLFYTAATNPLWRPISLSNAAITLASSEFVPIVFVACDDGSIHAFNPVTAELLGSSPTPLHSRPLCLLPVPSENALFAGLYDGAVVRVHLPSLAFDCMLGCGVEHTSSVYALASDNHYLFSAGDDGIVLVWDIKELTTVRDFSVSCSPIRSLLRVNFVLWMGLKNGSVQVLEIFGDDLNGVSKVSEKHPHTRPVTSLVQVGDSSVWSVEEIPAVISPNAPFQSHVAIWDTRDFSFVMADDLDDMLIRSVAVVNTFPYQRVTVAALSTDLAAKLVVREIVASPKSRSMADPSHELYVAELENQLAQANEHIRFLNTASIGTSAVPDNAFGPACIDNIQSPSPNRAPLNEFTIAKSSTVNSASKTYMTKALDSSGNRRGEAPSDSLVLSSSVSDALQSTLSNVADLLVSLLTKEVLAAENSGSTSTTSEHLRNTVATLTKELNIGRQLVACCASGDETGSAQLLGQMESSMSSMTSPQRSRSLTNDETVRDLRRRLDDMLNRTRQLETNLRDVSNERDLLKDDVQHEREQAERTMSSLEGLIRERNSTIDAKNATIAELRLSLERSEDAIRAERHARNVVHKSVVEETERLAEVGRATTRAYEEQLKASFSKIEKKSNEIQRNRDTIRTMESEIAELRDSNEKLEERCKEFEKELADATAAVNAARKDLAANIAAKEAQHRDAVQKLRQKHDCELTSVSQDLDTLRHDYEQFRKLSDQTCETLRAELEALRQAEKEELSTLQEKTNQRIENLRTELDAARRETRLAQERISELETELGARVTVKGRDEIILKHAEIGKEVVTEEGTANHVGNGRDPEGDNINCNEIKNSELSKIDGHESNPEEFSDNLINDSDMVENIRGKNEKEAVRNVELGNMSQLVLIETEERDSKSPIDQGGESDKSDEYKNCLDLVILREEVELLKSEVEHRQAAAILFEEEAESMRSVIIDLREATNELQLSLEHSEDESRHLYTRVDEMRAAVRMRDMRIAQLEGRVAALSCTSQEVEGDRVKVELDANAKAIQALLASANGEIEQMTRELEAMYRAQFAREKELQSLHEAISMRDEKIRARDIAIEDIRSRAKCTACQGEHITNLLTCDLASAETVFSDEASDNGKTYVSSGLLKIGDSSLPDKSIDSGDGMLRGGDTLIWSTLKELEEGMIVTQGRLRDVTRLAREYKSLAMSNLEILPALHEVECELARVMQHAGSATSNQLMCARGIVQSIIAQHYSTSQKRQVLGESLSKNPKYAASSRRLAALHVAVRKLQAGRTLKERRDETFQEANRKIRNEYGVVSPVENSDALVIDVTSEELEPEADGFSTSRNQNLLSS